VSPLDPGEETSCDPFDSVNVTLDGCCDHRVRYELVVHPRLVGHGPTLFAGLSKRIDLKLVSRLELGSGTVAMQFEPRR
jgi:hypothetical protein